MNKDQNRYEHWADISWFEALEDAAHRSAKERLKARKARQATLTYPKSFKSLATRLKRFLGLS